VLPSFGHSDPASNAGTASGPASWLQSVAHGNHHIWQVLYVRAIFRGGDDSASCNAGDDQWLILASDGLFANEERGGGGGLENQEVVDVCNQNSGLPTEKLAQKLVLMAQEAGSTDDITVVVLRLK